MAGKFTARFQDISAAADFLGNGAIEVNRYESELVDLVRRHAIFLQRVDRKPATGHPHRYFEQLAIAHHGVHGMLDDGDGYVVGCKLADQLEHALYFLGAQAR